MVTKKQLICYTQHMKYSNPSSITTETKVALGILTLTVGIIISGLVIFKNNPGNNAGKLTEETVMKNIDTGLLFSKSKVTPPGNPKVTGEGKGTATTSTSTLPIEITEFMDYECPACAYQGEIIVEKLLEMYGSRLVITRRILPVHGEPAIQVARMVLASQEVSFDAYQKMHAKVLSTQDTWSRLGRDDRETFFRNLTKDLGLDYDKLVADGKTPKYAGQIDTDKADALELGIRMTPSFIINNTTRVSGGVPPEFFAKYIDIR